MKRRIILIFIPIIILITIYIYLYKKPSANEEKKIIVYTYSSFASSWGPGPELKKLFKEKSGMDVEFVDAGEAGIITQRILLEKKKPKADLVLGLDQFQLESAIKENLFAELPSLGVNFDKFTPVAQIQQGPFIAINWAPMTFIFRKSDKNAMPKKLDDFVSKNFNSKIILLDPRTSSPGFIFFNWVVQKYGEAGAKEFLEKLKKNVYTVTPSWSAGYGLFKKKQSDYIFSYLTSPTYHWIEEKDADYQPLYLEESLPYHIEYAAILKSTKKFDSASQLLQFLFSPEAQELIMNKNYMLSMITNVSKKEEFKKLKNVKLFEPKNKVPREDVLRVWKSISW